VWNVSRLGFGKNTPNIDREFIQAVVQPFRKPQSDVRKIYKTQT